MEFNFEDFKNRALDDNLSLNEKIGFPDSYRDGKELDILEDILQKVNLKKGFKLLDIGCGCSKLTYFLGKFCKKKRVTLYLNDSEEMLSQLGIASDNDIKLIPGKFPEVLKDMRLEEKFDVILVYSVLQYVYNEGNLYSFINSCLSILKNGGVILFGDIPNISSRNRFLNSKEGSIFLKTEVNDTINIKHEDDERVDDDVIISILQKYRNLNCETYLLPQNKNLPFANRREDILIKKR